MNSQHSMQYDSRISRTQLLVMLYGCVMALWLAAAGSVYGAEGDPELDDYLDPPIFQAHSLQESLALLPTPSISAIPFPEKPQPLISNKPEAMPKSLEGVVSTYLSGIEEIKEEADEGLAQPVAEDEIVSEISVVDSQESILPVPATSDSMQTPSILSSSDASASAPGVYPFRAEFLRTPAEAMRLCDEFLLYIIARKYDKAFQIIRPHFPISNYQHEELYEGTKKRLGMAELRFGRPLDYVFIGADTVGNTVLRYRYLQKFDLETLLWEFTFYRPQSGWLLNAVGFEAEAGQVFRP